MKVIKTDSIHFKDIKDFPYGEQYVDFNNLKMHYIDEGEGETILALQG